MPELEKNSVASIDISPEDTKFSIRTKVWKYLEESDIALGPKGPKRKFANFKGSSEAEEKMFELEVFKNAKMFRVDPDKMLQEIRCKILEAGKTLFVPTPRLRNHVVSKIVPPENCSNEVLRNCCARQGIEEHNEGMDLDGSFSLDIYIVGSIAVSTKGFRIGKGGGLSDLEYGMVASLGAVNESVPVVTIVHDCQVLDLPDAMFNSIDLPVDIIVTPTRVIECTGKIPKPTGIIWKLVEAIKLEHIPVLKRIRYRQWKAGVDVKLVGEDKDPVELVDAANDESQFIRSRGRGYMNNRRSFNRGEQDQGDGEMRKDRGDSKRGRGWPSRGRYRSYRNRRFTEKYSDRQSDRQSDDHLDTINRNSSFEKPGNRAYDRRTRQPYRRQTFDSVEGSIYVGSLPRSLRVSEFKTEVRERKVNPLRVLWRGSSGFAFLNFKSQQDAEEALVALEGLHISDRAIKFEMAKSPTGQKRLGNPRNDLDESNSVSAK